MDVILGTAGHIDHGKTTLVRALTGIDCDRLEEEKRRGITIELGFAWLDLPDGRRVGIVDVPGHERFIKNMVAGASGVDCVLLVVAADEGIMPQTREHLEICSLLGVRSGLVALTKADQVDAEWLKDVQDEVRDALAGSFLANAPMIPVSAVTGEGLDRLRNEIASLLSHLDAHERADIFRLPVDRVFSMRGHGTIVTGTIVSGSCSQGEQLCMIPADKAVRARNLQVHNEQVERAREGQRCAINLQGLEVEDIQRGDVVARPDTLFPVKSWIMGLTCLKSSPLPIRQRAEVHFHHGTRECLAKIVFRDRDLLEPGQSALAEVKFDTPMAAIYGDHCVIRAHSPLRTIAGGVLVDPMPPALVKRNADYGIKLELLQKLGEPDPANPFLLARKTPDELAALSLALWAAPGTDLNHLQVLTNLHRDVLVRALKDLEEKGEAYCWDFARGMWVGNEALDECMKRCCQRAEELHAREPLKSNFSQNALTDGWGSAMPQKFLQEVINRAVKAGLLQQEGTGLKLAGHSMRFDKAESRIMESLTRKIEAGGKTPPFIKEIAEERGWEIKKIQPLLNFLCDSGKLLKLQDGVYYDKIIFARMVEDIRAWFENHEELEIGNIKEVLGLSRKYAIPVLEYLDNTGVTYRVGNKRRLKKIQKTGEK